MMFFRNKNETAAVSHHRKVHYAKTAPSFYVLMDKCYSECMYGFYSGENK